MRAVDLAPDAQLHNVAAANEGASNPFLITRLLRDRVRAGRNTRMFAVAADILALSIAFLGAGFVRFGDPFHGNAINMLGAILPVYMFIATNNRCFHLSSAVRIKAGAWNAITAFLVTLSVIGLVAFFLKVSAEFSRAVFGTGAVLALILLPMLRFVAVHAGRRIFGEAMNTTVVIEDGVKIDAPGAIRLDARQCGIHPHIKDPIALDRLGRFVEGADRVIVACLTTQRSAWAVALKGADVNAEVLAPDIENVGAIGMSRFADRSTLIVAASPLGALDRMLKRGLDLLLVVGTLPVVLPLAAVIAIAVKLDSPGPVFFAQQRVGLGNRLFRLYKFRSMHVDAEDAAGALSTQRGDDRITRVGRSIRATSLDELPQLLNVLTGAMSIVGPRPHALGSQAESLFYWDIDPAYSGRHAVKPGLTGLAQVRGYRGTTERTGDLKNRLQADLEYLAGWTIWRDLAIIAATFRVLAHRNAF